MSIKGRFKIWSQSVTRFSSNLSYRVRLKHFLNLFHEVFSETQKSSFGGKITIMKNYVLCEVVKNWHILWLCQDFAISLTKRCQLQEYFFCSTTNIGIETDVSVAKCQSKDFLIVLHIKTKQTKNWSFKDGFSSMCFVDFLHWIKLFLRLQFMMEVLWKSKNWI